MPRYIDTDKIGYHFLRVVGHSEPEMFVTEFEINAIPAADVVEVKHGKWEVLSHGLTLNNVEGALPLSYQLRQCSECEYVTVAARAETHKWCPHCGAIMDGGSEE